MGNVATPARPAAPAQLAGFVGVFGRLGGLSTFGPLLALIAAIAIFGVLSDRFLRPDNLTVIVQQVMVVGTLGVGQTLVILTGGIDLSNGAIMVFASILMAKLAVTLGLPVPLAILIGLLAAACLGAANGLLVTRFRLPPFIVTLGMLNIVLSITLLYSGGSSVTRLPDTLLVLGRRFDVGGTLVTYGSLLMLVIFGIAGYVLKQTAWGTHVYAIGNNAEAARLSGIRVNQHLLTVYALGGLIYGIAGVMLLGRVTVADPLGGQTANLDSITAVVIGGTSLFGGRGSVLNTLIGALIVGVLRNGLTLVGIDALYQTLATGVLVIVAVAVDQFAPAVERMTTLNGTAPILEAHGLVKRYGNVTALDGTDFELLPREVLAVIGDNGAGKSTLIKVLAGAIVPDEGEILLDGKVVHFKNPMDARRRGIETVYQDLAVAPALDIASNLYLGRELRRAGPLGSILRMLDKPRMRQEAARYMAELRIGIGSTTQAVETLSGGQRQGVAVARAAAWAQRLVIMDEPTAALGVKESAMVLDLISRIKERGLPVILISHNMPNVFEVADRIHIQRLGQRIAVVTPQTHTMAEVVAIMTGALAA